MEGMLLRGRGRGGKGHIVGVRAEICRKGGGDFENTYF